MKFLSKQSLYRVVLRPGQPAEKITGRAAVVGLSVRFENNEVMVPDDATDPVTGRNICELLKEHEAFNQDYILYNPEESKDPWQSSRKTTEPEHDIIELEYGHVGKNLNPRPKLTLNNEQRKAMEEMAMEMAKEMAKKMAPELAKDILTTLASQKAQASVVNEEKPDKKTKVKDEPKTTDKVGQ